MVLTISVIWVTPTAIDSNTITVNNKNGKRQTAKGKQRDSSNNNKIDKFEEFLISDS